MSGDIKKNRTARHYRYTGIEFSSQGYIHIFNTSVQWLQSSRGGMRKAGEEEFSSASIVLSWLGCMVQTILWFFLDSQLTGLRKKKTFLANWWGREVNLAKLTSCWDWYVSLESTKKMNTQYPWKLYTGVIFSAVISRGRRHSSEPTLVRNGYVTDQLRMIGGRLVTGPIKPNMACCNFDAGTIPLLVPSIEK